MRIRALAYGILVFAAIDLIVLAVAPLFGWIDLGTATSQWTVAALALAFFLALMAMIGSISVLATDFPEPLADAQWRLFCGDCGRPPDEALNFCNHCGSASGLAA